MPQTLQEKIDAEVGQRYGSLVVVQYHSKKAKHGHRFLCQCDCGGFRVVPLGQLHTGTGMSSSVRACAKCCKKNQIKAWDKKRRKPAGSEELTAQGCSLRGVTYSGGLPSHGNRQ